MYTYAGIRGVVLNEFAMLPNEHRRRINKDLFQKLPRCLNLQQALSLKGFGGPILQNPDVAIYVCKVNTGKRHKYRIPFAPFRDSYIVLTHDTRDNLDFKELANEALIRYREATENNAYEYIQPPGDLPSISYR